MRAFKFVLLLSMAIQYLGSATAQRLDLFPGTKRLYRSTYKHWPSYPEHIPTSVLEEVLETVTINDKKYAKTARYHYKPWINRTDSLISADTVYFRMQNDTLWRYNDNGTDDFVFPYHISKDGDLNFGLEAIESDFYPTTRILADTVVRFPNQNYYRVYWGADSVKIDSTITINQLFVDSLLYDTGDQWLLPLRPNYERPYYGFNNWGDILLSGFYYIDGVGSIVYPYNHLRYYLNAFISSEGDTMGEYREPNFYVSTEPHPTSPTFSLHQNYPNPFNPSTTISYELYEAGFVELTISDVNGRLLRTVVSSNQSAGNHQYTLDLSDYASGVYFYTLSASIGSLQKQMTLVK